MPRPKILLATSVTLLIAAVLGVLLAPVAVAGGVRLWLRWAAPRENLLIEVERINAPFLRPVVLHHLHLASRPGAPFAVKIDAARVALDLNLVAIFQPIRGRKIRSLTSDTIEIDIRRATALTAPAQAIGLHFLKDLLAGEFTLSRAQLHLADGGTIIDLRDATLSATEIEAGVFTAREFAINSPWLRKTFVQLRGATSWQEDRLTVGALLLTRGLDLDALTIDLSHIGEKSFGLELSLDAFGGKFRSSVSSEDRAGQRWWDAAASVSEVSLAQMSDALEFSDRASGSVHAGKVTFRGEAANLDEASATIWAEVTGLTWRDRTADTIMIGASLYHREVQIEQAYVKQRSNQFTLSGEFPLPQNSLGWLNPDFRGDLSASIDDLGDFARLFGANPSDFAGTISLTGMVHAHQKKLAGQLAISGHELMVSGASIESFTAQVILKESQLVIEQFELHRHNDLFRVSAKADLTDDHSYTFTLHCSGADFALTPDAQNSADFTARGEIDFNNLRQITLKIYPQTPMIETTPLDPGDCVNGIDFAPGASWQFQGQRVDEIDIRGKPFSSLWTISLRANDSILPRTFSFCRTPSGKTLTLESVEESFR